MKSHLFSFVMVGLCAGAVPAVNGQQFTFTTIAGQADVTGNADGVNNRAYFAHPYGLAVDHAGNVFVADHNNNSIRKITAEGTNWIVTTIAGAASGEYGSKDGINGNAQFFFPDGVTVDKAGNLYVADSFNHAIRRISPQGADWVVSTIAGKAGSQGNVDGTNTQARFDSPVGITIDNAGKLFVTDFPRNLIRMLTPIGNDWIVRTIAGRPLTSGSADGANDQARFYGPRGIAADHSGNLFVGDYLNCTVRKISQVGTNWVVSTIAGLTQQPGSADGTNNEARFNMPQGLALDSAGNLYVADSNFYQTNSNCTIRKLTPSGTNWVVTTVGGFAREPGTVDGTGSEARFNQPWGVAVDGAGNLYVADFGSHTIRLGKDPSVVRRTLHIDALGDPVRQILLSWPVSDAGYILETTTALSPGSPWRTLSNGLGISGESFVLTNSIDAGAAFYRLRK